MKYKSTACICFYSENTATTRNSITGKYHEGSPMWLPEMFANGDLIDEMFPESEYPFRICSYKPKLRGLSMMSNAPTLQNIGRTNFIEMNSLDAKEHGLTDGQEVVVESAANQTKGVLKVREGVAKGTIGVCFGYGKWEYGSKDIIIDGETVAGDPIRGEGTATNQLGLLDPTVDGIYGLSEATTGSPNRNSIRVKVKPV
jgi:tetrathionate reductase subunit A